MTAAAQFDPADPRCPQCGGEMWNNISDNAQKTDGKRRPDFRCKENRDHVIWPPKPPKRSGSQKQGFASGDLPGDPAAAHGSAPARASTKEEKRAELASLAQLQRQCAQAVVQRTAPLLCDGKEAPGVSPESAAALINTLFIAAKERGLYYPVEAPAQ
jgi:hypothetical protein